MAKSKGKDKNKKVPPKPTKKTKGVPATCQGCNVEYPSKNALFRHLRLTCGKCLPPEEYQAFLVHVLNNERNLDKIAVLYGYLPATYYLNGGGVSDANGDDASCVTSHGVAGGDHASMLVVKAIEAVSLGRAGGTSSTASTSKEEPPSPSTAKSSSDEVDPLYGKVNRSFGFNSRASSIEGLLEQDAHTGAMTELLCCNAPPLLGSEEDGSSEQELQKWLDDVNSELKRMVDGMGTDGSDPGEIRVFGRVTITNKKFNAESDVTCRRIEYLMPLDFLVPTSSAEDSDEGEKGVRIPRDAEDTGTVEDRQFYFDSLPSFRAGDNSRSAGHDESIVDVRPAPAVLTYLHRLKKIMQSLTTHVVELDEDDAAAVLEKEFATQSRKKQKGKHRAKRNEMRDEKRAKKKQNGNSTDKYNQEEAKESDADVDADMVTSDTSKGEKETQYKSAHVLKRKRFHNFSPQALAHDFLSFRRMDRFYHKATIRYDKDDDEALSQNSRPFVLLSLTGDMFLSGQARSVIGLFVAICQGIVDEDIIDCIFDEDYPSLIPAPLMPRTGLYGSESQYMAWEGRLQTVLNARRTAGGYAKGWNDDATNSAVEQWRGIINREIAKTWCHDGIIAEESGRLRAEKEWVDNYLTPWGKRANEQLKDYRRWKEAQKRAANTPGLTLVDALLPPLESVDDRIPQLFTKVLQCLRDADASGKWPSTSPKRQLVMVSTNEDGSAITKSLSSAHMKAKSKTARSVSAYSLAEGQGGASGSFSVGAFPPNYDQPKGNELFPELMKAAFELEIALCPDREPSSTIAVNRNAQFRPHTDSGAGAGQCTSLIVGLGHYVGGELMVEGQKCDIRYKAREFNGWKQRHWTLPFTGERFSLVWFTPKGCEGIRGIDLS